MSQKTKICRACEKKLNIRWFYANKFGRDGYDAKCKSCKKLGIKIHRIIKTKATREYAHLSLFNPKKEDWIQTYKFLKVMGYDLSSEKTIHEQFCEKYNLKTRERMTEKSIQYSPKDLGLV